jgi:hypothetical protein
MIEGKRELEPPTQDNEWRLSVHEDYAVVVNSQVGGCWWDGLRRQCQDFCHPRQSAIQSRRHA